MTDLTTSIHLGGRMYFSPSELLLLKAQENYTFIHLLDGSKYLVATTLGKLEDRLKNFGFMRANRSTLVNLDKVIDTKGEDNKMYVRMSNSTLIDVSRRRKQLILEALA